jgi:hypothetical protein
MSAAGAGRLETLYTTEAERAVMKHTLLAQGGNN